MVLTVLGALDEIGSGVAPLSAAEIRNDFDVAYSGLAAILLVVPLLLAMCVEAPLALLSDRWPRRPVASGSVALMGVCMLAAATTTSAGALAIALGVWAAAGGVGCTVVKSVLMDAYPDERERWMTRWTLMGTIGDACTPLLLATLASWSLGWRGGLACVGGLHLLHAAALVGLSFPAAVTEASDEDDDASNDSLLQRVRAGLRDRELVAWLGASALCALLDEILVAFGTMYMRDELGIDTALRSGAFAACSVAAAIGLVATDWLLTRMSGRRLLVASSIGCIAVFVAWLVVTAPWWNVVLLAAIGLFSAPLYPICAGRAYALRPGQPGLVAAVDQVFAPVAIVSPLLVGLAADYLGIRVALALLLMQPVGVGLVAWFFANKGRSADGPATPPASP